MVDGFADSHNEFVQYVWGNYVKHGIDELAADKLSKLLQAKYDTLDEAQRRLGDTTTIRRLFVDCQQPFISLTDT